MPYRRATGKPTVKLDVDGLERRIADAIDAQGITDQAGWTAFISTRFNATNAAGLSAGTRALMIEFLTEFVNIG